MADAILGVILFGHDATACLVDKQTGEVIYAIEEERLNNVKHTGNFPIGGIKRCEEIAKDKGMSISDIAITFDEVGFIEGTLANEIRANLNADSEKLINTILELFPYGDYYTLTGNSFATDIINSELAKLKVDEPTRKLLKLRIHCYYNWAIKYKNIVQILSHLYPSVPLHRVPHHLCHAASAFFNSGFEKATIVTLDGQGESETACIYIGDDKGIRQVTSTRWPYSLGIFYLNVTNYLGFRFGDEYKVMGMAAYGEPKYYDILKDMVEVKEDGSIVFKETEYFGRQEVSGMYGHFYYNFKKEIVKPRSSSQKLRQEHFDFACSVQKLIESLGVEIVKKAISNTKIRDVAMAGGVALNCLMNEKIRLHSGCDRLFIYPAAGDDGTAVGAAQYIAFKYSAIKPKPITTCFYGYGATNQEIEGELKRKELVYTKPDNIHEEIARAIADNKIVARYTGRSEFGPRALGDRSILADPRNPEMKDILNERIKQREPFRPFAPACLRENVSEYFEIDIDAPFMLLVSKVKAKSKIPAVVHNDGTARVQTVSHDQNETFYRTIEAFRNITGIPVVINTSFNVNQEAIVDTPLDAIESFGHMDTDYLAIGDFWLSKEANEEKFVKMPTPEYLEIRKKRFSDSCHHILKNYNMRHFYYYDSENLYYRFFRGTILKLLSPLLSLLLKSRTFTRIFYKALRKYVS